MFDSIESDATELEIVHEPYCPFFDLVFDLDIRLVFALGDFWMGMIDICIHQIIEVSFFFVHGTSPVLAIPKDSVNSFLLGIFILCC